MDWNLEYIADLVRRALEEDIGSGDATCAVTIPPAADLSLLVDSMEET